MNNHEDFLGDVVHVGRLNAEPLQAEPDEARVSVVDRADVEGLVRIARPLSGRGRTARLAFALMKGLRLSGPKCGDLVPR